jgi:hypothetical protein
MTVLVSIGFDAPCYRCFVEMRGLTYSGEGRWSTAVPQRSTPQIDRDGDG